ncbi:MAG: hypothetical protein UR25_C0001G0066 [Candidatus Nomurabacteria bacterium GW2011_GWE1_32_28]|uniref:TrbC/VIRB2 family protein n=1 Tax=Candidatus Nomurabacteria bacterium GW2011_GWF1_31_48 TaxID=1618767 RepID=A0A0G0AVF7_9BACT|nr:MAG: hypothetical protein UR10_C0001G0019 [Candidatus Nomurabacteria bacterium GW2011_GWF2_30_133]KKP28897.1 MAG: hypothetical protein UR18_C0001G0018 [Candidatus Nomurabacteria bacterium GW2011_GWE2_31_40]KKP30635.1 MAG: hypothetical protein UR19_C0001G0019 [Candidatus Nomurabacteria bacterium GW2011_GWF1_31_48]KKP35153.1 MAG: hypothetical protein UR25_C0001G0066 [Candidatus Nomurabacteria bacterium GW2011_GWE1_32_28]HAS80463.1 hypothetical protein [Candidatus Nomurabacteria bacterium]
MKKKLIVLGSSVLSFMPFIASAQTTIQSMVATIGSILNTAIPVLIILGVLYFVYGVVMFVIASDEEAKTKGRNSMIYGIIGLVVIVAMWGLVGIVQRTFGIDSSYAPNVDLVPTFDQ